MKRKTLLRGVLLALLICLLLCTAAVADEFDGSRNGSITLNLTDGKGNAASGGEFWLFRVGDAVVRGSNLCFELTADFAPTGVSLEDLNSSAVAETLAAYAQQHSGLCLQSRSADRNGRVGFSRVPCGLYLVMQKTPASGYGFERMSAFVAMIPMTNESGTGWDYDVTAKPKVEKKPTPTPTRTPGPSTTPPRDTKLPQTGLLMWPVLALAGLGVALFALGWFLRFTGKRHE